MKLETIILLKTNCNQVVMTICLPPHQKRTSQNFRTLMKLGVGIMRIWLQQMTMKLFQIYNIN